MATLIAGVAFLVTAARGRRAPRINDFTTDLADPPAFVPTSVGPLSSTVRCVRGAYANAPHRRRGGEPRGKRNRASGGSGGDGDDLGWLDKLGIQALER